MGIYPATNRIFGIKIYTVTQNDEPNILLDIKYDTIMDEQQKRETRLFYENLDDKQNILFRIYTECVATHEKEMPAFKQWFPVSTNFFLENFQL